MGVQCEYLGRKFAINKRMLKHLQSIDLISEIEYTEQDTAGGLSQVEIKGYKPQSVKISYVAVTAAGVDPYQEYCIWKNGLGKTGELFVGQEQFGVDVFMLQGVSMHGAKVDAKGSFVTGTIELTLTQDIAGD